MKFKAVIFDLDGTLVHTTPKYRYKTTGRTLKEFGKKATKDIIDKFWFEGKRDKTIKKYFGVEPKLFWNVFREKDNITLRMILYKS